MKKSKILIITEYGTLAHPARSSLVARFLSENYDVHFASKNVPAFLKKELAASSYHELQMGLNPKQFSHTWLANKFPWTQASLLEQFKEDKELIAKIKPDLILSDLRLGMELSARAAGIPFVNLTNAFWSPFNELNLPLADNATSAFLPETLERLIFKYFGKLFVKRMMGPVVKTYSSLGFSPPSNLFEMFTAGDYVFYLDPPFLYQQVSLPQNHTLVGPIQYSLAGIVPEWIFNSAERPIFVSLGSSGRWEKIEKIILALNDFSKPIIVSTAGRQVPKNWKARFPLVHAFDFVNVSEFVKHSCLVVSNGGAPLSYLCLEHGVPNLMVTGNTDQELCATVIQNNNLGQKIRASRMTTSEIYSLAQKMIFEPDRTALSFARDQLSRINVKERMILEIEKILNSR